MNKLEGLHPLLIAKVEKLLAVMNTLGYRMIVTDGVRTTEQQKALYAQGRTKPGSIVTNADGVNKKSNHQAKIDGFGYAVDCTFLDPAGRPSWDMKYPWKTYGECAKALGLVWGGDWTSLKDYPHIEMPS